MALQQTTSIFVLLLCCTKVVGSVDIYVSSSKGNDDNNGLSPNSPVQSIAAAMVVRKARMDVTATVHVGCGLNQLQDGINIPGNTTFTAWSANCSSRMQPSTITGAVHITNLEWVSVQEGVYKTAIPKEYQILLNTTFILINEKRRVPVRTKTLYWTSPLVKGKGMPENQRGFVYNATDIPSSWDINPAALRYWTVHGYHSWTKSYHKVAYINRSASTIHFTEAAQFAYGDYTYCSQGRWAIEGAQELFPTKQSGQWKLMEDDDGRVHLLYAPVESESIDETTSVVVPNVNTLFTLKVGSGNIQFKNLEIGYTSSSCYGGPCDSDLASDVTAAIVANSVVDLSFVNVTAKHIGGTFLEYRGPPSLSPSHKSLLVDTCVFVDIGASAVFASSPKVVIRNNTINGFGQRYPAGVGVNVASSINSIIVHNDISNGYYNGIGISARNDTSAGLNISYNMIHNNGKESTDGICDYGGLHIGATNCKEKVYIHNNIIANITAFANGGVGLYTDVSSTGVDMRYNLVIGTISSQIQWHTQPFTPPITNGVPQVYDNNIFIASRQNDHYEQTGNYVLHWDSYTSAIYTRNIVYIDYRSASSYQQIFKGLSCNKSYPNLAANCTNNYVDNFQYVNMDNNVYYNNSGALSPSFPGAMSFYNWKNEKHDRNSLNVDPQFDKNFQFQNEKLKKLGIEYLDISNVGLLP
eukprot:m.76773 g.76773  ORF g.76773 m.76773 type:complete len:696 (+) comp12578_c0_seq2:132-2219(+)